MPPRAQAVFKETNSSTPPLTVCFSTIIVFAILTSDSFTTGTALDSLNNIDLWAAILATLLTYLVMSFVKVHLGSVYPSDCVVSLPLILLIILVHYLCKLFYREIDVCPVCDDNFCYFEPDSPAVNLVTREKIDFWQLNFVTNFVFVISMFLVMSAL